MADQMLVTYVMFIAVAAGGSTRICSDIGYFRYIERHKAMLASTFLTFDDYGLLRCAKQCMLRSRCQSFNFNQNTYHCQLNTNNSLTTVGNVDDVQGSLFSNIDLWSKGLAGNCRNHTCPSNYVCEETENGSYACKVECPDPNPLEHGTIASDISRDIDAQLEFNCSHGYIKIGEAVCQKNGSWSVFSCEKGCANPPTINNARLEEPDNTWVVGSVLNYTCEIPFVMLGRVECTVTSTWTAMQCIYPVRSCSALKTCNAAYSDGEYWLVPEVFEDKPVKIYCQSMTPGPPLHYLTLPEENFVDYSDTTCGCSTCPTDCVSCPPPVYTGCQSTRFQKVQITDISRMKVTTTGVRDLTFTNQSSHCYFIFFGIVNDCHQYCGRSDTRDFVVDTRQTGVIVDPAQEWLPQANPTLNTFLSVSRTNAGRTISGRCHQSCQYCHPKDNTITFVLDPDYTPPIAKATVPVCLV